MSKKNNDNPVSSIAILIERGIENLLSLIFKKKEFAVFPKGEITEAWNHIESSEGALAIIEADKLVDNVLRRGGIMGESMADRLRKVEGLISRDTYQGMWDAHKLRNNLVHEMGHHLDPQRTQATLWKVKKFLTELGAFKNE